MRGKGHDGRADPGCRSGGAHQAAVLTRAVAAPRRRGPHQSGSGSTSGWRWSRCWRSSSELAARYAQYGHGSPSGTVVSFRKGGLRTSLAAQVPRKARDLPGAHWADVQRRRYRRALYDRLNPWGPSDDFYLSFVMAAPSVLDVGCGTGRLLHRAREAATPAGCAGSTRTWRSWSGGAGGPVSSGAEAGAGVGGLEPGQPVRRRRPRRPRAPGQPPGRVGGRRRRDPHRKRPRPAPATRCASTGPACASSTWRASTRSSVTPASRSRPATGDWSRLLIGASDNIVTVARAA